MAGHWPQLCEVCTRQGPGLDWAGGQGRAPESEGEAGLGVVGSRGKHPKDSGSLPGHAGQLPGFGEMRRSVPVLLSLPEWSRPPAPIHQGLDPLGTGTDTEKTHRLLHLFHKAAVLDGGRHWLNFGELRDFIFFLSEEEPVGHEAHNEGKQNHVCHAEKRHFFGHGLRHGGAGVHAGVPHVDRKLGLGDRSQRPGTGMRSGLGRRKGSDQAGGADWTEEAGRGRRASGVKGLAAWVVGQSPTSASCCGSYLIGSGGSGLGTRAPEECNSMR